jgi:hypothetical protein
MHVNSKHTKTYGVTKKSWIAMKIVTPCCQMACYVIIMEDRIVINCKG